MVIEKWLDGVFIWSSENGNITIEIPFGWYTPKKWGGKGDSQLTEWKRKHKDELKEFKKLTGDKFTLKKWRKEKRKISHDNGWDITKRW